MSADLEKREKQAISSTAPERMADSGSAYSPDVDIYASNEAVVFLIDLPGVGKGDVQIQIDEDDTLIVRAKNSSSEPGEPALRQYFTGDYYRAFQISEEYDKDRVSAKLENGLLMVTILKREEAKPRRVEISA